MTKQKTNQLLAPVGSKESLIAAIDAGANAVFLSGAYFGARAEKANFDFESLQWAVETAHLYALKVYITLNTLIKESELKHCYNYIDKLIALSVDAIIVQDLAVISYIRTHYPEFEIHASTQMSIYNKQGLANAEKLGLKRVVVARELSYTAIQRLINQTTLELEVFIHGALCHGFSGQCLISSISGGRSANRGKCAQTCRLKFDFQEMEVYAMSMKDLSSIDNIEHLRDLGIASFKIEGRLRSPDYVYHTVKAYRAALDQLEKSKIEGYKENMELAFNRQYTEGHLFDANDLITVSSGSNKGELVAEVSAKPSKFKLELTLKKAISVGDAIKFWQKDSIAGTEIYNLYQNGQKVNRAKADTKVLIDYKNNIKNGTKVYRTKSKSLSDIRTEAGNKKKIAIDISIFIAKNRELSVEISDKEHSISLSTDKAVPAKNRPLDEQMLYKQFNKLGDTPFYIDHFNATIEADIYLSASDLNALRRQAIENLITKRIERKVIQKAKSNKVTFQMSTKKVPIIALIESEIQYQVLKDYDVLCFSENRKLCQDLGIKFALRNLSNNSNNKADMISNIGDLKAGQEQYFDYHSQVMNSSAYDALSELGAFDITLSPELNFTDTMAVVKARPVRLFAYGKLGVMYSQSCIKKQSGQNCATCSKSFTVKNSQVDSLIVDCDGKTLRYNTEKPLIREWCWKQTNAPLFLRFTNESKEQTAEVIRAIVNKSSLNIQSYEYYSLN